VIEHVLSPAAIDAAIAALPATGSLAAAE
jgi:hypothetical protein